MRNAMSAGGSVLLILFSIEPPALARDPVCDAQSQKGEVCLCAISALHPTQSSVGMAEVKIKVEKLKAKAEKGSEADFLSYLREHEKEEPVVIGPGGVFYITDHHHLARALFDVGVAETYCTIADNLSDEKPDAFWKQLEANNEVYLKDQNGNPITPQDLPGSAGSRPPAGVQKKAEWASLRQRHNDFGNVRHDSPAPPRGHEEIWRLARKHILEEARWGLPAIRPAAEARPAYPMPRITWASRR